MKVMGESVYALKHNVHSGGRNRGNTNQLRLRPNRFGGESRSRCYNCSRTGTEVVRREARTVMNMELKDIFRLVVRRKRSGQGKGRRKAT